MPGDANPPVVRDKPYRNMVQCIYDHRAAVRLVFSRIVHFKTKNTKLLGKLLNVKSACLIFDAFSQLLFSIKVCPFHGTCLFEPLSVPRRTQHDRHKRHGCWGMCVFFFFYPRVM